MHRHEAWAENSGHPGQRPHRRSVGGVGARGGKKWEGQNTDLEGLGRQSPTKQSSGANPKKHRPLCRAVWEDLGTCTRPAAAGTLGTAHTSVYVTQLCKAQSPYVLVYVFVMLSALDHDSMRKTLLNSCINTHLTNTSDGDHNGNIR